MSGCTSDDKEDKAVFGRNDTRVQVDLVHKLSLGDDHLILRGVGGLALFGNKYSDIENAENK